MARVVFRGLHPSWTVGEDDIGICAPFRYRGHVHDVFASPLRHGLSRGHGSGKFDFRTFYESLPLYTNSGISFSQLSRRSA